MPRKPASSSPAASAASTPLQGQYLAFIYAYATIHRRPPAEADMQTFFRVTPPSVHQMVLQLERLGLIRPTHSSCGSIHRAAHPTRISAYSGAVLTRNELLAGGSGRRKAALCVAAVLLGLPARARADQVARLVYVRTADAPTCPNEASLRSAVQSRLGYDPFRVVAPLTLLATIRQAGTKYRGELRLIGGEGDEIGTRSIEASERCEDVGNALALSISLAIDPLLLTRPPPAPPPELAPPLDPAPPPGEPAVETPALPTASAALPAPAPLSRVAIRPFGALGVSGWLGSGPTPSVGGSLAGGLYIGRWSIAAEVRANLPFDVEETNDDVPMSSFVVLGGVVPCVHVWFAFSCIDIATGMLTASADVANGNTQRAPVVALGPRIGAEWPLGQTFLAQTSLEITVPLVRHDFDVYGHDVYSPSPIWGVLSAGLAFRP